ncbi:hypothetical protein [Streptomyces sp. NPDC048665]|uniref:hypothetical protein n=1 Tax=Streptomyces sp. NPDC048665 TaxID=3155490 RepID=UPI00341D6F00
MSKTAVAPTQPTETVTCAVSASFRRRGRPLLEAEPVRPLVLRSTRYDELAVRYEATVLVAAINEPQ